MMRDEHYRKLCDDPLQYDRVIDWIAQNNRYAKGDSQKDAEEFASNAVNSCIRSVLYGDVGAWCTTGMCLAVRVSSNPDLPAYKKVLLAVTL